jgi:Ca2+-binding RTX toxin-like protein
MIGSFWKRPDRQAGQLREPRLRRAARQRRVLLEPLENRCMLAASDFQPLAIEGTASDDVIVVEAVEGSSKRVLVRVNGVQTGPFQPLGAIAIQGLQGNDSITIQAAVSLPSVIDGGAGLDTLVGGNGDDRFFFA